MPFSRMLVVAIAIPIVAGCSDGSDGAPMDAGRDASSIDAGRDATPSIDARTSDSPGDAGADGDMPPSCGVDVPGVNVGSACATGDTCSDGRTCIVEVSEVSVATLALDGTPGPVLTGRVYAASECTTYCSLHAPGTTCGECAACSQLQVGTIRLIADIDPTGTPLGICRPLCAPTASGRSGCRDGRACSLESGTCVDGCTSDVQCRYASRDVDGDGNDDVAYLGDAYGGRCDSTTGRCTTTGTPGAAPGDACTIATDCEDGGTCLTGPTFPDGYCTRAGCTWPGFECAAGSVCDVTIGGSRGLCLEGCNVGAESVADRLGTSGHGAGCAVGLSCAWDGVSAVSDAPNGGCYPGEYNDITVSNVGAPCVSADDCYSPYGYARCLFADESEIDSGICAIAYCGIGTDAILPGVESTTRVCDTTAGEVCANFGPNTFCVLGCDSASECAPGYACAGILSGGESACYPYCTADGECRTGACRDVSGGTCDSSDDTCFCSDRMPRT